MNNLNYIFKSNDFKVPQRLSGNKEQILTWVQQISDFHIWSM